MHALKFPWAVPVPPPAALGGNWNWRAPISAPGQLCMIDAFVAVLLRKLSYRCSACTSATRGTPVDVF